MNKVNFLKNMQLKDHECSVNGMDVKVEQETLDSTPWDLHQNVYAGVQLESFWMMFHSLLIFLGEGFVWSSVLKMK